VLLDHITPLVLTFNEAPNIGRVLSRLSWAKRVVVVDSFSTDQTESICRSFANVEFVQRKFEDHTSQWSFGLAQIKTEWVLTLDADYVLTHGFQQELAQFSPPADVNAVEAGFNYCILGRRLKASLYPPRVVLFRVGKCHFYQDGHTQKLQAAGSITRFASLIDHDDCKPLSHWLWAQNRYAALEVAKLNGADASPLPLQDKVRRWIVVAPLLTCFYTLIVKRLIFDGWPGWYYVFQRTLAEIVLSLHLIEAKLKR